MAFNLRLLAAKTDLAIGVHDGNTEARIVLSARQLDDLIAELALIRSYMMPELPPRRVLSDTAST